MCLNWLIKKKLYSIVDTLKAFSTNFLQTFQDKIYLYSSIHYNTSLKVTLSSYDKSSARKVYYHSSFLDIIVLA